MTLSPVVRVAPRPSPPAERPVAWSEAALVLFIFSVHALPVVAFAAGWLRGEAGTGYATVVAVLCARELFRELRGARRVAHPLAGTRA
jgi:hypothetical protein